MTQQSGGVLPGFDNNRRAFIVASFLALFCLLALLRLVAWQPAAILLVWLGVIKATGYLLSRQRYERRTLRVATASFCIDAVFLSAGVFFVGGAIGIGMAFYLFLVMVAASMLPPRNAYLVAAFVSGCFTLLALGEVSGVLVRPSFLGLPTYAGSYQLGMVTVVLAAATLGMAVYAQQGLTHAVREAEQGQRLLLESASDMIATLDDAGLIVRVNAAVVEQTGYRRDDLLGADMVSFIIPEGRAAFERHLELVRLGSRVPFKVCYSHAGGSPRWLAGTLAPVPDVAAGHKMLLIGRDVTQSKIAERDRERLRNELAQALRIQALGRLVSGVAHELNNPLTTILTTADDLLEGSELAPDDRESLGIVRQQAHRARATVRDLVAFVKSGSERKHERILPSSALAETLAAARPAVEVVGARLEANIPPDLEAIEIDRAGFDQVVTNIVMNAAQAAGSGGLITVRARVHAGFCEIVVEDSGPGIPADVLAHIFEPFYTTKSVGQGSGLGLSLSVGIVEHYRGTIEAENRSYSAEGSSGARFTVRIPVADRGAAAHPPRAGKMEPQVAPSDAPTAPDGRRTVLVIDDEAPIRRALRRYLERWGWQVQDVASAVEALPLLVAWGAADEYAAIICDIRMPEMTGLELCDRLRIEAPAMRSRMILTSGDLSLSATEMRECEAGGTLAKPYDVDELRALVDRIAKAPARG